MSIRFGTITIPLSETEQPLLLFASWLLPVEALAWILHFLSTTALLIFATGSIKNLTLFPHSFLSAYVRAACIGLITKNY